MVHSGSGGGSGAGAGNPMSFTENGHGSVVLERLRDQRQAARFCDVVLVVGGSRFPAHRAILAAGSPYLDSILKQGKVVKEEVRVNCASPDAFSLLLNYMYSGSVVITQSNVLPLLRLANNFLVSKLKNYCAEYLDRYLDPGNVLTVRELASKYNMPGLAKNAAHFLEANLSRVLSTAAQPLDWPLPRLETFLRQHPAPPPDLLALMLRWIGYRPAEREHSLKQLLALVPLPQIGNLLPNMLHADTVLTGSEPARFALLQAMYEASIPLHHFQTEYQTLLAKYSGEVNIYFNTNSEESFAGPEVGVQEALPNGILEHPDLQPSSSARSASANGDSEQMEEESSSSIWQGHSTDETKEVKQEVREEEKAFFAQGGSGNFGGPDPPALGTFTPAPIRTVPLVNGVPTPGGVLAPPSPTNPDAARPPLRLTLKVPLMTRKANLVSLRRKTPAVEAASQIVARRRGRPPKRGPPTMPPRDASPTVLPPRAGEEAARVLYRCPHCVYTSSSSSRISAHMDKAHIRNRVFRCNLCDFHCRWNREYYAHMKSHFAGPPFQCDSCQYSADRIQMILTHRMKHTDERPFRCPDCDYRCRTKTNLVSHQRSHTGERPFTCPECGRGFAIKSTLDQHLATHSDSRPFKCDLCSFSTKYQSHLISHKRIHTGDVFHCQFADCSYSSPKKSQLAAHLRTHLAVRAFQCRLCTRSFIEKSHLVRHERIHLQDKPFKCQHCEYASSRRDKLKEHILKHHNGPDGEDGGEPGTGDLGPASQRPTRRRARPRPRRTKPLATLSTLSTTGSTANSVSSRSDRDADLLSEASEPGPSTAATTFRPITPLQPHPTPTPVPAVAAVPPPLVAGVPLDLNSILAASPLQNRPHSAIFPTAHSLQPASHAFQPSPALSLNLSLDNTAPTRVNKDVLLSTQAVAPTPTLLEPAGGPASPGSLQSEPFPPPSPPPSDSQRPVSLPPFGAAHLPDFSFTAMF